MKTGGKWRADSLANRNKVPANRSAGLLYCSNVALLLANRVVSYAAGMEVSKLSVKKIYRNRQQTPTRKYLITD